MAIDITANAFLYHMVRNIAGSLITVGTGEKSCEWFKDVFHNGNRKLAGITAEAQGLCFMQVRYDPRYNIPDSPVAFPFADEQT